MRISCITCGAMVESNSPVQKYCSDCSPDRGRLHGPRLSIRCRKCNLVIERPSARQLMCSTCSPHIRESTLRRTAPRRMFCERCGHAFGPFFINKKRTLQGVCDNCRAVYANQARKRAIAAHKERQRFSRWMARRHPEAIASLLHIKRGDLSLADHFDYCEHHAMSSSLCSCKHATISIGSRSNNCIPARRYLVGEQGLWMRVHLRPCGFVNDWLNGMCLPDCPTSRFVASYNAWKQESEEIGMAELERKETVMRLRIADEIRRKRVLNGVHLHGRQKDFFTAFAMATGN